MQTQMTTETVRTVRDAHGAYCPTCDTVLHSPFWHFSKSKALHESGSGHKVVLFRIVRP